MKQFRYCPHCGESLPHNQNHDYDYEVGDIMPPHLRHSPQNRPMPSNWQKSDIMQATSSNGTIPQNFSRYEKIKPSKQPSLNHYWLPLFMTFTVACVMMAIAWLFNAQFKTIIATGIIGFGVAWFPMMQYFLGLLQEREIIENEPPPPPPVKNTNWLMVQTEPNKVVKQELPTEVKKIQLVAKKVLNTGADFTVRGMKKVLSRSEYEELRDMFIKNGWLIWVDPDNTRRGTEWTRAGKSALKQFARGEVKPQ